MCNSRVKPYPVAQIDGRAVLQPACNRVVERVVPSGAAGATRPVLKKSMSMPATARHTAPVVAPPAPVDSGVVSPRLPKPATKRVLKPNSSTSSSSSGTSSLNSSTDGGSSKPPSPRSPGTAARVAGALKKSKKTQQQQPTEVTSPPLAQYITLTGSTLLFDDRVPGSLAAAQREQALLVQAQRKMRIAHYGRSKSAKFDNTKASSLLFPVGAAALLEPQLVGTGEEKRCGFITGNSDPIYVAYHDEEWGVPVHDDNLLFELLVLSGAQVGVDWTTVLKKRQAFRSAFAGFDPEQVSRFTEKQLLSISEDYDIDLARVRGVVDNANRILEAKREAGSFSNYVWGFVNHKPLSPCYRSSRKVPVKTSKSETISKNMVRRGFRFVGPTVVHCFMQAAGITNDHVVSCPRHNQCATAAKAGRG